MTLLVRGAAAAAVTSISGVTVNAGAIVTSADIDNSSALELFDQIDLAITHATSVTTGAPWQVYLVPYSANDGTAGSVTTPPDPSYLVASWQVGTGTAAQRFTAHNIPLPPGLFRYVVFNGTATNSSASAVTLTRRAYHVA